MQNNLHTSKQFYFFVAVINNIHMKTYILRQEYERCISSQDWAGALKISKRILIKYKKL